jgi:hypothetical protein
MSDQQDRETGFSLLGRKSKFQGPFAMAAKAKHVMGLLGKFEICHQEFVKFTNKGQYLLLARRNMNVGEEGMAKAIHSG